MRIGAFEINEPVPDLQEPHALTMIRPWVDVGSVGSLALTRLERHFGATELGKLARPGNFLDFTRYRPVISMREGRRQITVPNSFINYAIREDGHDFLFLRLLEPHMFGEDYTDSIVELLKTFGVKRYALLGAMYDAVPHTRPLLVTGSMAGQDIRQRADAARVEQSTYEGPTTINYLVSNQLSELGIDTASVIVHLPQYAQLEEDFTGTARLLEVLQSFYGLPDHLIDYKKGEHQYQDLTKAMAQNPRLKPVIQQLERNYDARGTQGTKDEPSTLAPEVEDFLREMDQRFDAN